MHVFEGPHSTVIAWHSLCGVILSSVVILNEGAVVGVSVRLDVVGFGVVIGVEEGFDVVGFDVDASNVGVDDGLNVAGVDVFG